MAEYGPRYPKVMAVKRRHPISGRFLSIFLKTADCLRRLLETFKKDFSTAKAFQDNNELLKIGVSNTSFLCDKIWTV